MFRTVPLSIIRSFSLYTQQWYMSYRFADSLWAGLGWNWVQSWSCSQAVSKPVWYIPLLCVQWETPDDGQRNCPKHIEFYSKNKFEKLVHLVGFIIRIYHDAQSPEQKIFISEKPLVKYTVPSEVNRQSNNRQAQAHSSKISSIIKWKLQFSICDERQIEF